MEKPDNCSECAHWRQQSGSAHVLCPISSDFRLFEMKPCGLYKKMDANTERKCNAFMVWAGSTRPQGWPTPEEVAREKANYPDAGR